MLKADINSAYELLDRPLDDDGLTDEERQKALEKELNPTPPEEQSFIGSVARGVVRGAVGAVEETAELGRWAATGDDSDLGWKDSIAAKPQGVVGGMAEGFTQFLVGFIPALRVVSIGGKVAKAGKAGRILKKTEEGLTGTGRSIAKYSTAGALADFTVFDAQEERLSNLIQDYPLLSNPVSEFLAADDEDGMLEGRLKSAVEGVLLGAAVDAFVLGVKALKRTRELRAEGKSPTEVVEGAAKELKAAEEARVKAEQEATTEPAPTPEPGKQKVVPEEELKEGEFDLVQVPKKATPKKGKAKNVEVLKAIQRGDITPSKLKEISKAKTGEDVYNALVRDTKTGGRIINLDAYSDDPELFSNVVDTHLLIKNALIKTKKDFFSNADQRKKMIEELEGWGFASEADTLKAVEGSIEARADYAAKFFLLEDYIKQRAEVMTSAALTEKKLLRKGISASEKDTLEAQLKKEHLQATQLLSQESVAATALSIQRSEWGKMGATIKHTPKLRENKATAEEIRTVLAAKLDEKDITEEELAAIIRNEKEIIDRRGAAAVGSSRVKGDPFAWHLEFWMNSLLSGPQTHAVNAISNSITTFFLPLEQALGLQTEILKRKILGQNVDPRLVSARQELTNVSYLWDNFKDSLSLASRAFWDEDTIIQRGAAVTAEVRPKAISSQNLPGVAKYLGADLVDDVGSLARTPTKLLTSADELFKQLQFRHHARVQSAYRAHDLVEEQYVKQIKEQVGENASEAAVEKALRKFQRELDPEVHANNIAEAAEQIRTKTMYEDGRRVSDKSLRSEANDALVTEMVKNPDVEWKAFDQATYINDYVKTAKADRKHSLAASEEAFGVAREGTYTREMEGFGKAIQDLSNKFPTPVKYVIPFTATPVNIIKFFGERVPLLHKTPLLNKINTRNAEELASSDPLIRAKALGRLETGALLFAGAATLVYQGKVTGFGPRRKDERRVWESTGKQQYSLQIGDTWYSYQRLDPFAMFLGLAADMAEFVQSAESGIEDDPVLDSIKNEFVPAVATAVSQNIINKSYMTGLQRFIEMLGDPQEKAKPYFQTFVASHVPSILSQAKGNLDTEGDAAMLEARTVLEAITKRVPYIDANEPRRNVLGEIVKVDKIMGGSPILNYFNPVRASRRKNDAIFDEMSKAEHAFSLPNPKKAGGLNLLDFTNDKGQSAYDRLLELSGTVKINGRTLRQELQRVTKSPEFERLSDIPEDDFKSPRVRYLRSIIDSYRDFAYDVLKEELPDLNEQVEIISDVSALRAAGQEDEAQKLIQQLKGLR
jgi:hypothetical protein